MYTFFVVLHVLVSLFLIMVVLLQTGKGASMGAAFGGGSSTMFGARGQTTFIHKLTAGMALVFMVLSVALASLSAGGLSDLDDDTELPPPGKEAGMLPEGEDVEDDGQEAAAPQAAKAKPIKLEKMDKPPEGLKATPVKVEKTDKPKDAKKAGPAAEGTLRDAAKQPEKKPASEPVKP